MEDALIFEFSHHQMESTSGKSIPSILNRKRKLTTSSQKTFMVNIYFRICVFKCGFQTIHIWANLAQYFFQSENQSFPKFCLSTLHNIQKLYKNCPLPEKFSCNKIITYMIHTQQLCFCMCLLQIKKYHWKYDMLKILSKPSICDLFIINTPWFDKSLNLQSFLMIVVLLIMV